MSGPATPPQSHYRRVVPGTQSRNFATGPSVATLGVIRHPQCEKNDDENANGGTYRPRESRRTVHASSAPVESMARPSFASGWALPTTSRRSLAVSLRNRVTADVFILGPANLIRSYIGPQLGETPLRELNVSLHQAFVAAVGRRAGR